MQIAELSTLAGLSSSHFQRAFKDSVGRTPCSYVSQLRIERSKLMMRDTTQSLSQIALACGFSDQSHLSRLFRKCVGATPTQWRRATR
jgi:AraC-like DNA-binding protein